jgi:hypothetical protein
MLWSHLFRTSTYSTLNIISKYGVTEDVSVIYCNVAEFRTTMLYLPLIKCSQVYDSYLNIFTFKCNFRYSLHTFRVAVMIISPLLRVSEVPPLDQCTIQHLYSVNSSKTRGLLYIVTCMCSIILQLCELY